MEFMIGIVRFINRAHFNTLVSMGFDKWTIRDKSPIHGMLVTILYKLIATNNKMKEA